MDGKVIETGRATKLMSFDGLERVPVETRNRPATSSRWRASKKGDRRQHHLRSLGQRTSSPPSPIDPADSGDAAFFGE